MTVHVHDPESFPAVVGTPEAAIGDVQEEQVINESTIQRGLKVFSRVQYFFFENRSPENGAVWFDGDDVAVAAKVSQLRRGTVGLRAAEDTLGPCPT